MNRGWWLVILVGPGCAADAGEADRIVGAWQVVYLDVPYVMLDMPIGADSKAAMVVETGLTGQYWSAMCHTTTASTGATSREVLAYTDTLVATELEPATFDVTFSLGDYWLCTLYGETLDCVFGLSKPIELERVSETDLDIPCATSP